MDRRQFLLAVPGGALLPSWASAQEPGRVYRAGHVPARLDSAHDHRGGISLLVLLQQSRRPTGWLGSRMIRSM
jgi:hypothetical protein